jgi:hypothetical protein
MGRRFEAGTFNNPQEKQLPGQNQPTPHVLIGDEAFGLKPYLMRPFPNRQAKQDRRKEKYKYRLCRVRRVVEYAFGILAQKWRLYYRPSEVNVRLKIVKATCVLHNYLRTEACDDKYYEYLEAAEPVMGALNYLRNDPRRSVNMSIQNRYRFVDFLII